MTSYLIGHWDCNVSHGNFVRLVDIEEDKIESHTRDLLKEVLEWYFKCEIEGRGRYGDFEIKKEDMPGIIKENITKLDKNDESWDYKEIEMLGGFKFPKNTKVYWEMEDKLNEGCPMLIIRYIKLTDAQKQNLEKLKRSAYYDSDKQEWSETPLEWILDRI